MLAAAARRAARPPGGEDGYLLAGAMVLVAIVAILSARAAVDSSMVHRREKEKEFLFRAERIVRAIQDYRTDRGGQTGGTTVPNAGQWPKLEQLTKPPKRYLHEIPPDPLTAEYDQNGDLKQGTGQWQPIFLGVVRSQVGGTPTRQGPSPLPCEQKVPGWEKNKEIIGVYSCADGESVMMFADKPAGSAYREMLFYIDPAPQTGGGTASAGGTDFRNLLNCPGAECLPSIRIGGTGTTPTTPQPGGSGMPTSPFGGGSSQPPTRP